MVYSCSLDIGSGCICEPMALLMTKPLHSISDGKTRCKWVGAKPHVITYHDREWGVPTHDDRKHFEMLLLEGAQAGLTWETILLRGMAIVERLRSSIRRRWRDLRRRRKPCC